MSVNSRTSEKVHIKGIGWDGKTLKEMREEVDRLTRETGYYAGLKRLELKESDPITYEKLFYRLRGGLVDARETSKRVAASPIVEQEGELCFTLYTPDGDGVVTSTGIIIHVGTMGAAIKYMIANDYETNPGIEDGDIFINNDGHVGNIHTCDIHTLIPIFYKGELIAWAGGVTHAIETGGVSPGSMPTGPVTRFGDGYYVTCRKVAKNFELLGDWLAESKRAVRTTRYWTLDERTRQAGCMRIRELVLDIVEEYGVDVWKKFMRESLEDSRRQLISRIKSTLIPGKYRSLSMSDVPYDHELMGDLPEFAKLNYFVLSPNEITVQSDGKWQISTKGTSRWGWHPYNAHSVTYTSGIWVMMTQTLMPNERINEGPMYATLFDLPKGSWINPMNRITAHSFSWHFLWNAWSAIWRSMSRGYFSRGFLEEVNAGNAATVDFLMGGGINQYGEIHAINSFEPAASGTGACAIKDGIDHTAAVWNPEGDQGDMETWERVEPMLYLGRAKKRNSAGYGKYRGGSGYESLRMMWNSKDWTNFHNGSGYIFPDCGLMGGYPAATGYIWNAHKTDLKERIEKNLPFPQGGDYDPDNPEWEKNLNAEFTRTKQTFTSEQLFKDYDMTSVYVRGGPGFGDPLDRRISDVETDLNDGIVLPRYAEKVYGVVIEQDEKGKWHVDKEKTVKRRKEMLKERINRGIPTHEWIKKEREKVLKKEAEFPVLYAYATSFELEDNAEFLKEFKEFWELPDDWTLTTEDIEKMTGKYLQGAGYLDIPLEERFPEDLQRASKHWTTSDWWGEYWQNPDN